jgi:hypothetical protein
MSGISCGMLGSAQYSWSSSCSPSPQSCNHPVQISH